MANKQYALLGAGGVKTLSIGELDAWMDMQVQNATAGGGIDKFYQAVPWLFRGVELRAQGVATLPFEVVQGKKVVDSSGEESYENVLGFLPDPESLLWLIEASLTLTGCAYVGVLRNRYMIKELKYYAPNTIKPIFDKQTGELLYFERRINGRPAQVLSVEEVFYLWHPDPNVETGAPRAYPATAAMAASGVLFNLDEFVAAFFGRGAIKTSLVALDGAPDKKEREYFAERWRRAMQGLKNAWDSLIVNAKAVTVIPIGEGVKDLQNTELVGEKKNDIAAALNIPRAVLFSDSAAGLGGSGVAESDTQHFIKSFIFPRTRWIFRSFNEQLLADSGYAIRSKPETAEESQKAEALRAQAMESWNKLINECDTLEQFLFVTRTNGAEWNDEQEAWIKQVFAEKDGRRQQMQQMQPAQPTITIDQPKPEPPMMMPQLTAGQDAQAVAKAAERKQFRAYAANRTKQGKGLNGFEFRYLDEDEVRSLLAEAQRSNVKTIAYNSPEHKRLWDSFVKRTDSGEKKLGRAVADLMQQQQGEVLARVKAQTKGVDDIVANPFDMKAWIKTFKDTVKPILKEIIKDAGAGALGDMNVGMSFDLTDPQVLEFLNGRAQRFAEQVNQTTWDGLKASLSEGIADGESIPDLAARVESVMGDRIQSSAETIARTEVIAASNGAAAEGWRQSGVVTSKVWLAALDDRTRPTHVEAHGQTVPLDAEFQVGDCSGDMPGNTGCAEEDINCRCTATAVVE